MQVTKTTKPDINPISYGKFYVFYELGKMCNNLRLCDIFIVCDCQIRILRLKERIKEQMILDDLS